MVIDHWTDKGQAFNVKARKLEVEIAENEKRRKNIYEMRESGEYTKNEFRERIDEIDNTIASLNITLSDVRVEQFDIKASVSYVTQLISKLDRTWFGMSPKLKPQFQKLVFPEGISLYRNLSFGTTKLGLIYEANSLFDSKNSYVVVFV